MDANILDLFLPPVREWFRQSLGEPTLPQRRGWPLIAEGRNTLILAPTGSGKTLAAFLACLDGLWRQPQLGPGVRILYISPLKALNNDIHRNLQVPLAGVEQTARVLGLSLPKIQVGLRTGDTTAEERRRLVRKPPHVLITTPESLHLILTSQAREMLRGITHCIVDEIHALCPNKRGVFLALLLERLEAFAGRPFVRIGLSATQKPLEEVARFLAGLAPDSTGQLQPRPVAIVDGGLRKNLDLQVVSPVEHFGPLPEKSVWPSIYRLLSDHIREHSSTLVFANDRRAVERITACLNEQEELARAHHGSVSLEMRRHTEQALKEGRLPCVVATASLEMGIDMGAVDLVCQVASPGNVARGLQRVGRAGHVVGQKSKGRLIPRTAADLLELSVLAREMALGNVEPLHAPVNCLDVLAQQVVAMTAMDSWSVPALYALVRRAYPYRHLTPAAFETVLEMISGRYRLSPLSPLSSPPTPLPNTPTRGERARGSTLEALQPRVSWDRVHNRLHALPGSLQLAVVNGGTIPDTGQYAACTPSGVRVGELDEEFIYERRVGDVFLLGTTAWRLQRIEVDRVIVSAAEGEPSAVLPFWRGEGTGRSADLGQAIGRFLRELLGRLDRQDTVAWLQEEYHLQSQAARSLIHHVQRQALAGAVPTDRDLVIEASRDQLGDWQIILLSPLGARLHLALKFALEAQLSRRLGYRPQCLHHDDGLLVRLSDTDEPILDLLAGLTPDNVEALIREELAESALFALRFRQNAARALLMPRAAGGKRAPLWLQRLRGKDLLQVARQHPDFPIVVETFRECLHDHLDVPRLCQLLEDIRDGAVRILCQRREVPSAFASSLLFSFTAANLYSGDQVEPARRSEGSLDHELLDQLLRPAQQGVLDPRAVERVENRLRGAGHLPRSAAEMVEWLRRLGDLGDEELQGPMQAFLQSLQVEGRVVRLELPRCQQPRRWILAEEERLYRRAFGLGIPAESEAGEQVLLRFLQGHALVGLEDVLSRYPFERSWAESRLKAWAENGRVIRVGARAEQPEVFATPGNFEQLQRTSLGVLRREVTTVQPWHLADFVLRWQFVHPAARLGTAEGLARVLARLQGIYRPAALWEQTFLPARVLNYQARWLEEWIAGGTGAWVGRGDEELNEVAFFERQALPRLAAPSSEGMPPLSAEADRVLQRLRQAGGLFVPDLAAATGLSPGAVRVALWQLLTRGLVSNDHLAVARQGRNAVLGPVPEAPGEPSRRPLLAQFRQRGPSLPQGRWSALPWAGAVDAETEALAWAARLLERHGVLAREIAALDPAAPPWRVLYEVLSRLELTGEVRRGYLVEGLSGAQFALPEALEALQACQTPSTATQPLILLHSLDPANIYGAGAPLDVKLLDGGTRSLTRRPGNWLILRAGRPILLVESAGARLTALPTASRDDIQQAVALLPSMCEGPRTGRFKLTVEEWNGEPVTRSPGRELLEAAGFVRDYQHLTFYACWNSESSGRTLASQER